MFGNECNLNCKMCGSKGLLTRFKLKKVTKLNNNSLSDIISYFPFLENLTLSGGEPLLYRECKSIVKKIKKYSNVNLKIITNGNLINEFWLDQFCNIPFQNISISMDAATNKTYQRIRKNGNFEKVIHSIKRINEMKNGNSPALNLSFVAMRMNLHEMNDFMELAHKLNISQVSYQAIGNQRLFFYNIEKITSTKKDCHEVLKQCNKLNELSKNYGIKCANRIPGNILWDNPDAFYDFFNIKEKDLNQDTHFECDQFWKRLDISPEFYSTCCFTYNKKYSMIKVKDNSIPKISEIWNSDQLIRLRKMVSASNYNEICKVSCPKYFAYKTRNLI